VQWVLKLIRDDRGYGVVETLILVAASAAMAGIVVGILTPKLRSVHERAASSILDVTGSGY